MTNPHGTPIWYELLTDDPRRAAAFYEPILGWRFDPEPVGDLDYRMIGTESGLAGGVLPLNGDMRASGARPGWLFYIGVDDVDADVATLREEGGQVLRGPWEIPGIGRMVLVTDPDGAPFYLMRGAGEGSSPAFDPAARGKAAWHELSTTDQDRAQGFYGRLFGWRFDERLPIGDMGDYVFIDSAAGRIGATVRAPGADSPPHWRFYFRVGEIARAAEQVRAGGGTIHYGPVTVPTGEQVLLASDPEGGLVGLIAH